VKTLEKKMIKQEKDLTTVKTLEKRLADQPRGNWRKI